MEYTSYPLGPTGVFFGHPLLGTCSCLTDDPRPGQDREDEMIEALQSDGFSSLAGQFRGGFPNWFHNMSVFLKDFQDLSAYYHGIYLPFRIFRIFKIWIDSPWYSKIFQVEYLPVCHDSWQAAGRLNWPWPKSSGLLGRRSGHSTLVDFYHEKC